MSVRGARFPVEGERCVVVVVDHFLRGWRFMKKKKRIKHRTLRQAMIVLHAHQIQRPVSHSKADSISSIWGARALGSGKVDGFVPRDPHVNLRIVGQPETRDPRDCSNHFRRGRGGGETVPPFE